jgi:hypothetical protein
MRRFSLTASWSMNVAFRCDRALIGDRRTRSLAIPCRAADDERISASASAWVGLVFKR